MIARIIQNITLTIFFAFLAGSSYGQIAYDKVVQINGVVMTSDSLYGVPDVLISVKNKNKGTYTQPTGVFVLVAFEGDTLLFRSLGFRPSTYIIPRNLKSHTISLIQLMSQDTFYLNETIIHALPSKERFNFAFQNLELDDDAIELARQNSDVAMLRALSAMKGLDAQESQGFIQRDAAYRAAYSGQQLPMNIFSPIKWGQFIESWRRGDFKRKEKNK